MSSELEKDLNDEVYEDSFYDNEEELKEEEAAVASDDDGSAEEEAHISVSFACEDCDYRWDDVIVKGNEDEDGDDFSATCPMCGSMNVTQI
ncbi:MAG: hypothetical protein ACRCUT_00475 [Spirochaetota bacterium]